MVRIRRAKQAATDNALNLVERQARKPNVLIRSSHEATPVHLQEQGLNRRLLREKCSVVSDQTPARLQRKRTKVSTLLASESSR